LPKNKKTSQGLSDWVWLSFGFLPHIERATRIIDPIKIEINTYGIIASHLKLGNSKIFGISLRGI